MEVDVLGGAGAGVSGFPSMASPSLDSRRPAGVRSDRCSAPTRAVGQHLPPPEPPESPALTHLEDVVVVRSNGDRNLLDDRQEFDERLVREVVQLCAVVYVHPASSAPAFGGGGGGGGGEVWDDARLGIMRA